MITNAYGPTSNTLKNDFLTELRMVACLHDVPWILLDDFNIIRETSETTSRNPNTHSMLEFNNMIHDLELDETRLNGRCFTWSNKRPSSSFSNLDRVLLSHHWNSFANLIPTLTDLPTPTSDHALLSLKFKKIDNNSYRAFRFERHWFKYMEMQDLVNNTWNTPPSSRNITLTILFKLKLVRTTATN
jgi:hypothetical protein